MLKLCCMGIKWLRYEEGDMDTKFTYRKSNNNETVYSCSGCEQNCHNNVELRNHYSMHHKELYGCLKCSVVCHLQCLFYKHTQTHQGVIHRCSNSDCGMTFALKILQTTYRSIQRKNWSVINVPRSFTVMKAIWKILLTDTLIWKLHLAQSARNISGCQTVTNVKVIPLPYKAWQWPLHDLSIWPPPNIVAAQT